MLKGRYVTLDASGGTHAGTAHAPISKLCAVYYKFSDPGVSGNIKVHSLDSDVYSKNGATANDGVQQIANPPILADEVVVTLSGVAGGGPGDTVTVALFVDDRY